MHPSDCRQLEPALTTIPGVPEDPVRAFDPMVRDCVARVAQRSACFADLARSFPALLFAIATGYGTAAGRAEAIAAVDAGAPLRDIARQYGLAWWLRKLPAGAFLVPLPRLPDGDDAALLLANYVPANPRLAAGWLNRVIVAERACGGAFTPWVARHALALPQALTQDDRFLMLAAWAWFGGASGTRGNALLRQRWSGAMSPRKALEEMHCWRQRLALVDWLGTGLRRGWIADGTVLGYEFRTLRCVEDFIEAGAELDNCLDQFAPHLAAAASSIVGIRRHGRYVACIEIVPHELEVSMPTIQQLRGARNHRVTPALWQAAYAWLAADRITPFDKVRLVVAPSARLAARRELWAPYLAHVDGIDLTAPIRRMAGFGAARVTAGRRPGRRTEDSSARRIGAVIAGARRASAT